MIYFITIGWILSTILFLVLILSPFNKKLRKAWLEYFGQWNDRWGEAKYSMSHVHMHIEYPNKYKGVNLQSAIRAYLELIFVALIFSVIMFFVWLLLIPIIFGIYYINKLHKKKLKQNEKTS